MGCWTFFTQQIRSQAGAEKGGGVGEPMKKVRVAYHAMHGTTPAPFGRTQSAGIPKSRGFATALHYH